MRTFVNVLGKILSASTTLKHPSNGPLSHCKPAYLFSTLTSANVALPLLSSETQLSRETVQQEDIEQHGSDSSHVFHKWGFSESEINTIFCRCPSLRRANLSLLDSKLSLLKGLGLKPPDLVKIIHCRPRFLGARINNSFDDRLACLESFFGSTDVLIKAIVRNPSLLMFDFHQSIRPVLEMYEQMGISRKDLISMLLSRPTLISRSKICQEKLDYIGKMGVTKESKMYKYVVTLLAISRLETIREKLAHFVKFGLLEDDVLRLVGRSPLLLTLSIDKVQRNMTFLMGTMKLPPTVVLDQPFLLYSNLETTLKPRLALDGKIEEMGLEPRIKGPGLFTAFRMKEKRFIEAFVECHPKDIRDQLSEYYNSAKDVKRLAQASKKILHQGFPF